MELPMELPMELLMELPISAIYSEGAGAARAPRNLGVQKRGEA